jgi:ABC-type antimicrobial peptide transport system permease subunit
MGLATSLTRADAEAIARLPDVVSVAAGLRSRVWVTASAQQKLFALVRGTEPSMADINGWTFTSGKNFTAADVSGERPVAVMGRLAATTLFGEGVNPVGKDVQLLDRAFRIVGVMRAVEPTQDEAVFVPISTLQSLTQRSYLQTITLGVTEAGVATQVGNAVTALLRERHKETAGAQARAYGAAGGVLPSGQGGRSGTPDDFQVKTLAAQQVTKGLYTEVAAFALANMPKLDSATMEEMSGTLNRAGTTMTALLASIAGISLIVGGIGIMTIMLVSVTERTKEIGLRLAVGARRREVLLQFLMEALVLSLLGGVIGILAGIAGARGLTSLLEWPTEISMSTIAVAFGIAALVGIVFGYYPARRASQLDPIDALRHE